MLQYKSSLKKELYFKIAFACKFACEFKMWDLPQRSAKHKRTHTIVLPLDCPFYWLAGDNNNDDDDDDTEKISQIM